MFHVIQHTKYNINTVSTLNRTITFILENEMDNSTSNLLTYSEE